MLQFPTNVFPHNNAIEIDNSLDDDNAPINPPRFSFKFNGDFFKWGILRVYNNTTDDLIFSRYFNKHLGCYNGDLVRVSSPLCATLCKNGCNYKYNYTIFQNDLDTGLGKYDIYVGAERVQAIISNPISGTSIYLGMGKTNIHKNYYIRINSELKQITNYNSITGYITIKSSFSETTSEKYYEIYSEDTSIVVETGTLFGSVTSLSIGSGRENIRDPYYFTDSNGTKTLIGGYYIEIGEERRFITDYSSITGYIIIDYPFTTDPSIGDNFRIFSNFISTPYYFFKARKNPVIQVDADINTDGFLECSATYAQANNVGLKNYKFSLYQISDNESNFVSKTASKIDYSLLGDAIDTSHIPIPNVLSRSILQKTIIFEDDSPITINNLKGIERTIIAANDEIITINKPLPFMPKPNSTIAIITSTRVKIGSTIPDYSYKLKSVFNENPYGRQYQILCEITTQDGVSISKMITKTFDEVEDNLVASVINFTISNSENTFATVLSWKNSSPVVCGYKIYRKREDNNQSNETFIGSVLSIQPDSTASFVDYTLGNRKKYTYYITPFTDNAIYNIIIPSPSLNSDLKNPFTTAWDGWTITKIYYQGIQYGKKIYSVGSTFNFLCNIENSEITTNVLRNTHIGVNGMPKVSVGDSKYDSGSFQALLNTVSCVDETGLTPATILRIDVWKTFINDGSTYILKSEKGDVWIVNITDNTSISYDETMPSVWTTSKYNWIQVEDIENIIVT